MLVKHSEKQIYVPKLRGDQVGTLSIILVMTWASVSTID